MDTDSATILKPKNKGGRPKGSGKKQLAAKAEAKADVKAPDNKVTSNEPESIMGYKVADGFSWITVFPLASDPPGKKCFCGPWVVGDGFPLSFLKGTNVCLPNAVVNAIKDTVVMMPEDDLSDEKNPIRNFVPYTRFPHSDPIPATFQDFKNYRAKQAALPHPNTLKKR